MFENQAIDIPLLQSRAFNLRWASVPADVIPLTAADPDFPIAPAIKEAIIKYTTDGYFSYNDPLGYHPLKSALASKYVTQYHTAYHPENILPVNSAAFGIHLVCKALLNPGDEVIIPAPYWTSYPAMKSSSSIRSISFSNMLPKLQGLLPFPLQFRLPTWKPTFRLWKP